MNIKQQIIASCIVLAGSVFAFDAALTDPLAWLYADSKIATAERLDEVDVPANGAMRIDKKKFARFLDIYNRTGIWYLEGTHLAGFVNGWGSPAFKTAYTTNVTTTVEGALALSKLAKMYMEEIETRGLRDRWYQHVADEPGGANVPEYRITAGIVRRIARGFQDYTPSCKLYREVRRDILRALETGRPPHERDALPHGPAI